MTKFASVLLFLLAFILNPTKAQTDCATEIDSAQIRYEKNLPALPEQFEKIDKILHIHFYIVKKDANTINFTSSKIIDAINFANQAFEPAGLSFALIDTTIIDNYQLYNIKKGSTESNLVAQYSQINVINVYLVDYLKDQDNKTICGYTYYPSAQKDYIMLRKGCFSEYFFLEQLGHFFNLYHTHETTLGKEMVNRDDCYNTGDKCCDTPADPGLDGLVNNCSYSGSGKDSNNDYYTPTVTNHMSGSEEECMCKFTTEQLKRVVQCIKVSKAHLY